MSHGQGATARPVLTVAWELCRFALGKYCLWHKTPLGESRHGAARRLGDVCTTLPCSLGIFALIPSDFVFHSSKVKETGQVKRSSRGAATAAPTTSSTEPRRGDHIHRSYEGAICELRTGPAAHLHHAGTHAVLGDGPGEHRARDRVCWL